MTKAPLEIDPDQIRRRGEMTRLEDGSLGSRSWNPAGTPVS